MGHTLGVYTIENETGDVYRVWRDEDLHPNYVPLLVDRDRRSELCPTSGGQRSEITGTRSGDDITKYVPVGWDGGGDETFWR